MTVQVVVSVYDSAVDAFGRPFFVPTVGAATRSFVNEVNRVGSDNAMAQNPADYHLYELGTFDDQTGRFVCLDDPKLLLRAADCLAKANS